MFDFLKKKQHSDTMQSIDIPDENFNNVAIVAEYFQKETGITFEHQLSILTNKVKTFAKQRQIYSYETLLNTLEHNSAIKQELIDYLTTNETYFFREYKQVEQLVNLIKQRTTKVDILCAPCATGEEPYSIAIALLEANIPSSRFHIVGIDINEEALEKAKTAHYKQRNIKNIPPEIIPKYFYLQEEKYFLKEEIKTLIRFEKHNIFESNFKSLGKFDYIFSRNMLIYFDKKTKLKAKQILESLRKDSSIEVFFGHADLF